MKKIFVIIQIIIIVCVSSDCVQQVRPGRRYYEGYIYTIDRQPIRGLNVCPVTCADDDPKGKTNEHGYFKVEQAKDWVAIYLIIESEGRIIDSIERGVPTSCHKHRGLKGFDDRTADTFFIDMEGKRRGFSVLQKQ